LAQVISAQGIAWVEWSWTGFVTRSSMLKDERSLGCQRLVLWAASRGIVTHPHLDYLAPSGAAGLGVHALAPIETGELLCLVPLEACPCHELWVEEVSAGSVPATVRAAVGTGVLGCALLLLREHGLGARSLHAVYIESLPIRFSNLLYFSDEDLCELRGTAMLTQRGPSSALAPETWCGERDARHHFEGAIRPFLYCHPDWWPDASFDTFRWATAAVLSRGIFCEGRGPFLVPFADAFNHAFLGDNHCQVEGDAAAGLAFVVRAVRPADVGVQLFNSYGSLPSSTLLATFGFVSLAPNPHDGVEVVRGLELLAATDNMSTRKLMAVGLRGLCSKLTDAMASSRRWSAGCRTTCHPPSCRARSVRSFVANGALRCGLRIVQTALGCYAGGAAADDASEALTEPRATRANAINLRAAEKRVLELLEWRLKVRLLRRRVATRFSVSCRSRVVRHSLPRVQNTERRALKH